jgi:hypothetical protein
MRRRRLEIAGYSDHSNRRRVMTTSEFIHYFPAVVVVLSAVIFVFAFINAVYKDNPWK